MKQIYILFLVLLFSFGASAQFSDNFNDGDYTSNPAWLPNTGDFIVNASLQLQSNNTVANAGFYLSTPSTKATTAQWDFYTQLTFNTSSTNYADVFLTASAADVTANGTTGYFVRLGGTNDEICLYRKDAGANIIKIIDGIDGVLNSSNNILKIRVIRNAANQWQLLRDVTGAGNNYFNEGTVTDASYTSSAFFGISIKQSTASFFGRHYFDDIQVQDYVPDVTPPAITSVTAFSANTADVLFNEAVDLTSSEAPGNYSVSNGIGFPSIAVRDATNPSLVHLTFTNLLPIRTNITLTVNGIKDLAGNTLTNGTAVFSYFVAVQYDVVIDELMADPTPQVSLPNSEWLELRNTSAVNIDLQGWKLGKAASLSGPMPSYILKPDSFVVVCTASAVSGLAVYGPVISVTNFPSLNNDADLIYLQSKNGNTIHAVNYKDAWYKNELKKDGGWTLEMIDTKNPCAGFSNWQASTDAKGGTPAKKNSVDAVNPDKTAPKLIRAFAGDATHITLVFDESTDSASAAAPGSYFISNGIGTPLMAFAVAPLFSMVTLTLSSSLSPATTYTITATGVKDCSGNSINSNANTARVGPFSNILAFDIVVNEILFNPVPGVEDYVELYNRSSKILNLKNAYLGNRNTSGIVSSITQISASDYAFFPGDFIVITKNKAALLQNYLAQNPDNILELNTPSYNDDKGNVIILNEQGKIIDEISYTDKWQFPLLSNKEGVALERIDYNDTSLAPLQQKKNWHSAASSVGYGTPTFKNSQFRTADEVQGEIKITPDIFSPDNDGIDDFATINYQFPENGYVASITIFDATGRPVRYLQKNALSALKGIYRWDGLGENQKKLPVGLYIIYTEIFNLQGKIKRFKNTIVLARRI